MAPPPVPSSVSPEDFPIPRVLLVDDDPSVRLVCSVNLSLAGFDVSEAEDGAAAFERARLTLPDLVLSDLRMPVLDGFGLLAALRGDERTRHIPVVLLSGETTPSVREEASKSGVAEFITKPFDPLTVVDLLRAVLARRALARRLSTAAPAEPGM